MQSSSGVPSPTAWKTAHDFHCENYICLVSRKPPLRSRLLRRLFGNLPKSWEPFGYRVSIAEMQRMRLRALQFSLAKIAAGLQIGGQDMSKESLAEKGSELKPLIEEFSESASQFSHHSFTYSRQAQAVRDYEYMTKVSQGHFDFFIVSSERFHDNEVLEKILHDLPGDYDVEQFVPWSRRTPEAMERDAMPTGPWSNDPEPLGGTRGASIRSTVTRNFWKKAMGAVIGGAFLVGPMWLLVLQRDLYLNLGVASGFVFGFGLTMVGCLNQIDEVFASTLAYAAVVMVFVGVMFDKQFSEGG